MKKDEYNQRKERHYQSEVDLHERMRSAVEYAVARILVLLDSSDDRVKFEAARYVVSEFGKYPFPFYEEPEEE